MTPTRLKSRSAAPIHLMTVAPDLEEVGTLSHKPGGALVAPHIWMSYSRRFGLNWSKEKAAERVPLAQFWPRVLGLCEKGWKLRIIAPDGALFLTVSRFWPHVQMGVFRVMQQQEGLARRGRTAGQPLKPWMGRLVLRPQLTIVGARTEGKGSVTILSVRNYADVSAAALCRSVGVDIPGPPQNPLYGRVEVDPGTYCFALSRWFRTLITQWVAEGCGPWGDTAGQLSLSAWRATDGAKSVQRHGNEEVIHHEVQAMHGGRAQVWFYGPVGDRNTCPPPPADPPADRTWPAIRGRCHKLDVRSLYPWLLATKQFPVKLQGRRRLIEVDDLRAYLRLEACIATVELQTDVAEYPLRTGQRIAYPTGRFTTTLAGPELVAALTRGHVTRVFQMTRYRRGEPFAKWGKLVLGKRAECREKGDVAGETLWKLVAVSLGGKFAQKSRQWLPCPDETADREWGDYPLILPGRRVAEKRRALAGIPHRLVEGLPGGRLPAAVFAYLTSYGRLHMSNIRSVIGPANVVSQQTDGLFVTDAGLRKAKASGLLSQSGPGSLRLVASYDYARFWDSSHYYTDGKWTLAGVARNWSLRDTATVSERRLSEPSGFGGDPIASSVTETLRIRRVDAIRPVERVDSKGWAVPDEYDGEHRQSRPDDHDRGEDELLTPQERRRRAARRQPPLSGT